MHHRKHPPASQLVATNIETNGIVFADVTNPKYITHYSYVCKHVNNLTVATQTFLHLALIAPVPQMAFFEGQLVYENV